MASDVQICNMALSHVGSAARVTTISPPDGSVEAGHCATFYSVVRLELIELFTWRFSLKRATLAEVANDSSAWAYAYALPSDCITPLRVLGQGLEVSDLYACAISDRGSAEFDIEGQVVYTNEPEATLVYKRDVTDTTRFTPGFTAAFGFLLASYLAGPIVKGGDSVRLGDGLRQRAISMASAAATISANSSAASAEFTPSAIAARA
jgi:hypothetical protein